MPLPGLCFLGPAVRPAGDSVYCSKCGGAVADGAAFCPNCGQAFAVAAAPPSFSMMGVSAATPLGAGGAAIPPYAGYAAVPRVEYAGFWVRFLAWLIDNVVMGVGVVLILIPLIFLTGLHGFIGEFHPNEDMNDAGVFMLIAFVFVLATASLVVTRLYHPLMEGSEWQGNPGEKALRLVGTDMVAGRAELRGPPRRRQS